jgi:hypothetical protein
MSNIKVKESESGEGENLLTIFYSAIDMGCAAGYILSVLLRSIQGEIENGSERF